MTKFIGFLTGVFLVSTQLNAANFCYTEKNFPSVTKIREGKSGLEFVIAGKYFNAKENSAPVISLIKDPYTNENTWDISDTQKCEGYQCYVKTEQCEIAIPEIILSVEEGLKLRSFEYVPDRMEQNISVCVKNGDDYYFGISFYQGEGTSGVGGIGRYDTNTKEVEIRRLPILNDSSVTHLKHDGERLWISSAHYYECGGTPPEVRLIWYDWKTDTIEPYEELCGFLVKDIHISENTAWVATELGLSRISKYRGEWSGMQSYVPMPDSLEIMPVQYCDEQYTDLLENLPAPDLLPNKGSREQLIENLIKYKPRFIKKYIQKNIIDKPKKEK